MSYDHFAHTFSESRRNHPWPELDFILADMKSREFQSVLDVGCGNGRFLEEAEKQGYVFSSYFGLDSSMGMIEEARGLHPNSEFGVCDMLTLSEFPLIPGTAFDAILFLASFHHLQTHEERAVVLANIKKFLAPRGRIYMTNWNLREQPRYEKSHQGNGDFSIKIGTYSRYYHGFTIAELESLFFEAGYQVVENRIFEGGRNILSIVN